MSRIQNKRTLTTQSFNNHFFNRELEWTSKKANREDEKMFNTFSHYENSHENFEFITLISHNEI